jgi:2-polyprenyl-3-methyl-5-hydroxy-6-metoxy-1,4-benzoquinol methylase
MQRHLEPQLMEDLDQAVAFSNGSRDYGIQAFLKYYAQYGAKDGTVIDLGCGPGAYLFALENTYPNLAITGYDGGKHMIQLAIRRACETRSSVKFDQRLFADITGQADCVISTNTLHHMHDPQEFWDCVKRLSNQVLVMDLVRPESTTIAQNIVDVLAAGDSRDFKIDYYNSLLAAFNEQELQEQIQGTGLSLTIEGDPNFLQVAIIHGRFL